MGCLACERPMAAASDSPITAGHLGRLGVETRRIGIGFATNSSDPREIPDHQIAHEVSTSASISIGPPRRLTAPTDEREGISVTTGVGSIVGMFDGCRSLIVVDIPAIIIARVVGDPARSHYPPTAER